MYYGMTQPVQSGMLGGGVATAMRDPRSPRAPMMSAYAPQQRQLVPYGQQTRPQVQMPPWMQNRMVRPTAGGIPSYSGNQQPRLSQQDMFRALVMQRLMGNQTQQAPANNLARAAFLTNAGFRPK